jgi:hypothetical protein
MNHHHRKTLHALFAHPISANIHINDVESLLREVGAEIDTKSGGRIGVTLNGHTVAIAHVSHTLPKEEVVEIKKFLEANGATPDQFPL